MQTDHGDVVTPAFMPVGTKAVVSSMTPDDVRSTGTQIILGGNTYHMLGAPGLEVIKAVGGMHKFMSWPGPMLTDSGGFQVFSLSKKGDICRIDEEAATFRSPKTGDIVRLTPEASIQAQQILGADIIMAFDHCTPDSDDKSLVEAAMHRTHRWLARSMEYHARLPSSLYGHTQALFGIIQGAGFRNLREESAAFVVSQETDGIALGGETIGYNMPKTLEILDWVRPLLPSDKPLYTMGVGATPQDLLDVVRYGADMFDCVAPTRNARHGSLYCGRLVKQDGWLAFLSDHPNGRINLNNQAYALDEGPLMDGCTCSTCARFSRAYLRYLLKENNPDYFPLASIHNVHVMQDTCKAARELILAEGG